MNLFNHVYTHTEGELGELIRNRKMSAQAILLRVIKQEPSPMYKSILDHNLC